MSIRSFFSRRGGFVERMLASFPNDLQPPEPIVRYFHWLEAVDAVHEQSDMIFALADPEQRDFSMLVEPVDPDYAVAWTGEDDLSLSQRMAAFLRTGGDGSYAGLWRNDDGYLKFVHQGSGSGSTLLSTLTDDPIDFLRLIAIGYDELCWPETFDKTPEQVHSEHCSEDDELGPFVPRHKLREWVETTFNVTIPATASEIITSVADMDESASNDPFWLWLRSIQERSGEAG